MAGSSVQNVSSTSIDGRVVSCNIDWLFSIPPVICPGVLFPFGALTSTATSLVPRECSRVTHSIALALDLVLDIFEAFMPLGAIRKVSCLSQYASSKNAKDTVSTSLSAAFANWVLPGGLDRWGPAAAHAAMLSVALAGQTGSRSPHDLGGCVCSFRCS
jgi:hypothetical protein